jgi:hypothetical protein
MTFPCNSQFITFNYTSTLQTVYGIDDSKVLHIHGSVDLHHELIFGHGKEIVEPTEFDEDGESTGSMFSEAEANAMYPLRVLQKPVLNVLNDYEEYFSKFDNVNEIIIIGHSLNSIDWPYFSKIADTTAAEWKVVCYDEEEEEIFFDSLVECGVPEEDIAIIEYSDLV